MTLKTLNLIYCFARPGTGFTNKSYGLKVAKLAGVLEEVIQGAEQKLGELEAHS